ncbi:NAD-dependent epimerase/dehydratase family protein [Anatilimnocola floriformis]|uniref:NAD-dependent epimerase/dehydratase family protein n=1 Tax=Anatilimnocola floriformis TaxID=2948575 RepID=UPI0020C44181|nr:NAD-dependent epimerase/dehydratase family protein [Anatilimnocola floriformis]
MIVAITGGTGFIGRKLVERHLAAGDQVRVLTRSADRSAQTDERLKFIVGDLAADQPIPEDFLDGVDVLYHCAGELRDPQKMAALHVRGTELLLDAAAGRVGRWVQLSSVGVYGPQMAGVIDENWPMLPRGEYEQTKARADELVLERNAKGEISAVIVRPSIVFGPQMPNRSLFQLLRMIERGWFFFIGSPGASANYVYVDNVIDVLQLAADANVAAGSVYNISDQCTLEQFATHLASARQIAPPRLRCPTWIATAAASVFGWLPGFPLTTARVKAMSTRAVYSSARAQRELGYVPRVSIAEGIRRLVSAVPIAPCTDAAEAALVSSYAITRNTL